MVEAEHVHTDRCQVCDTPLAGALGAVSWVTGVRRSRSNPNVCNRCNTHIIEGNVIEVTVMFADLSGFTEMTQELGPQRVSYVVDQFLRMASDVLVKHDGFIDKYIGDSVMAIFNVPIQHTDHASHAVAAALDLQAQMSALRKQLGMDLKARVSIASGFARVGQLGSRSRRDYTAIGDAVNIAARLEGHVKAGEVLLHEAVFNKVAAEFPAACAESFELKGFKEPINAYRIVAETGGELSSCLTPYLQSNKYSAPQRALGVGSTVFALLGAPCAAGAALSPVALMIGASSALTTVQSSFLGSLDQPLLRLPLQLFALSGMAANIYTVWRSSQVRKQAESDGSVVTMTKGEKRRTALVVALAIITLLAFAAELYFHVIVGDMPVL
jgi:adenylate cyclase